MPAGAGVLGWAPRGNRLLARQVELRRAAEAVVSVPGGKQFLRVRPVKVQSLRLPVRATRPAGVRTSSNRGRASEDDDRRLRFTRGPFDVCVLDAQDGRAAVSAREKPVKERSPGVADMQLAGRTGR
jgi:hypothetical protein